MLLFSFKPFTRFSQYLDHYSDPLLWPVGSYAGPACFPPHSSFLLHPSQQACPHLSAALSHLTLQKAGALASSSVQMSPPQRSERPSPITRVLFLFFNLHRKCLKFYYAFLIVCWLKKNLLQETLTSTPKDFSLHKRKLISVYYSAWSTAVTLLTPVSPSLSFKALRWGRSPFRITVIYSLYTILLTLFHLGFDPHWHKLNEY